MTHHYSPLPPDEGKSLIFLISRASSIVLFHLVAHRVGIYSNGIIGTCKIGERLFKSHNFWTNTQMPCMNDLIYNIDLSLSDVRRRHLDIHVLTYSREFIR